MALALLLTAGVGSGCAPADATAGASHRQAHTRVKAGSLVTYTLDDLDTSRDGQVSRAEFRAALERKFKQLDSDGSGKIDVLRECSEDGRSRCQSADKSGDGHVDLAEFLAHGEAEFDRVDVNKNGSLSADEIRELHIFAW
jgi:hypothetical protein